jgi:hypothetical protein
MRLAFGSKPLQPRHQMRRVSDGADDASWRQYQRLAARFPKVLAR